MRRLLFPLMLICAAVMLTACASPWVHPDYPKRKQAEFHLDKDATDCNIVASEEFPLSKNKQLPVFEKCMQDKGWIKRERGDGMSFGD